MNKLTATTDFAKLPSISGSRNAFKYNKRHFTTFNVGEITPIYFNMLIEPGDTITMDLASLVRTTNPKFPSYDNLICEIFAFWRSHNDMYVHFPEVMGQNTTGDWIANVEYSMPKIIIPKGTKISPKSILAHLCWPIQTGNYEGNKIGNDLYHYICNEYFNNNTVMPPVLWSDGDENVTYDGSSIYGGTLRKACKLPDYFNTGVPTPQRANQINLPLGISAPLKHGDINGTTYNRAAIQLRDSQTNETLIPTGNTNGRWSIDRVVAGGEVRLNGVLNTGNDTYNGTNNWVIETSNNSFADLREATAVALNTVRIAATQQQIYEGDAYFGTRAREIIKSRWGVNTATDVLHIPELIGYQKFALDTYQVAQTSQNTENSNIGELGAYSQTGNVGHLFTKSFDYWGSIMIVAVVRQEQHTYAQGLPVQFSKSRRFDFHWPEMEHLGFTATYKKELYLTGTSQDEEAFNYRPINQEYRYERDEVTGEFNPSYEQSLDYMLYVDDYDNEDGTVGNAPVFSAEWVVETPENVDRNLVYSHTEVDQIQLATKFSIRKISKLAEYGYPGLTRF